MGHYNPSYNEWSYITRDSGVIVLLSDSEVIVLLPGARDHYNEWFYIMRRVCGHSVIVQVLRRSRRVCCILGSSAERDQRHFVSAILQCTLYIRLAA